MKKFNPGDLVTTTEDLRMDYYGYWLQPGTMYEYFRPGDIGIVSHYVNIPSLNIRPGVLWAWVNFCRNGKQLRVQMFIDQCEVILKEYLIMTEEEKQNGYYKFRHIEEETLALWYDEIGEN